MRADSRRIFAAPQSARQPAVSRADAAKSAQARQQPAPSDDAGEQLVSEACRLLLALASVDPAVSGPAMHQMRDVARRYARHVHAQIDRS